jgi:hypothetical protein
MIMKRVIFALMIVLFVFVAVFGVLVLRPVPKVRAGHHGCSDATLQGNYGLVGSGWYGGVPPLLPANASAIVNFDGKGGFSGYNIYVVLDGTELTTPTTPTPAPFGFSGEHYTVNPDCSFSVTFTEPDIFKGEAIINGTVVDTEGDEIIGNVLSKGTTATFKAKKVPAEALVEAIAAE